MSTKVERNEPTNGGASVIDMSMPYVASVTIEGVADFLFHRWNCEGIAEKAAAAKGSKAKKTDDLESYVYRNDANELAIPGEYLRMAMVGAAKFRQDPRSPRKSAMDLFKAAVIPLTPLASLGISEWDYEHRARVMVQRNGVTRCRPGIKAGWTVTFEMMCNLPEYVPKDVFHDVLINAGRLIGIGDHRPTYGRFVVTHFDVMAPR